MFKNLVISAIFGALGIILGAFGAHALKEILQPEELQSFETAVRYQMYHVIVLLFVNIFHDFSEKQKNIISYLFFLGILCFSGSIYCIQLTVISSKSIWFVTPLGGLFFIIGWLVMLAKFLILSKKSYKKDKN